MDEEQVIKIQAQQGTMCHGKWYKRTNLVRGELLLRAILLFIDPCILDLPRIKNL